MKIQRIEEFDAVIGLFRALQREVEYVNTLIGRNYEVRFPILLIRLDHQRLIVLNLVAVLVVGLLLFGRLSDVRFWLDEKKILLID